MCPYCGKNKFVETQVRDPGFLTDPDDPASKMTGRTFVNRCKNCDGWSLHTENTHTQSALVEKSDPQSEAV